MDYRIDIRKDSNATYLVTLSGALRLAIVRPAAGRLPGRDNHSADVGWPAMSEPCGSPEAGRNGEWNGAEERTRTSTRLPGLAPEASASANSATPALGAHLSQAVSSQVYTSLATGEPLNRWSHELLNR